ncbi:hypothetical protein B9Z55_026912 [Caenorhabditis nigoni]|uniref:F-box domain-containing protein n=1 Tax=Caenorhabditis nigoni TaxID=1611254 RepID=A0A2G5SHZ3_9PELO|nr:hypothetical protein B9Z55_026912 [Caenorhabditis nigoni]
MGKKLSVPINTNDHDLKTYISKEVVKKIPVSYDSYGSIPIYDSYRKLCKLVGYDAITYPDYAFWYYRFYQGEMDFDYDRSADPVPKTIMDMPVRLMYKITENLDPVERANLRHMNKPIRDIADSHAPIFNEIKIHVSNDSLTWHLNDKVFACNKKENGCLLWLFWPVYNASNIESDKSVMKKSREYLIPLFEIPKIQVNHLFLAMTDQTPDRDDFLAIQFHAKSAEILVLNIEHTILFLLAFNPGELESISLKAIHVDDRDHIPRFFETEQFKQAKHVHLRMPLNEDDLLQFSHFKSFKFVFTPGVLVDFQSVLENISSFEQFESCELRHFYIHDDFLIRTIGETLGEDLPFGPLKTITHRYRIPESNEYFEFKIEDEGSCCDIEIIKIR